MRVGYRSAGSCRVSALLDREGARKAECTGDATYDGGVVAGSRGSDPADRDDRRSRKFMAKEEAGISEQKEMSKGQVFHIFKGMLSISGCRLSRK